MGKLCSNCGDPVGRHGAKGYCGACYMRWRRNGDPAIRKYGRNGPTCSECDEPARVKGYCLKHYERWRSHGDPSVVLPGGRGMVHKYALDQGYFDRIDTEEKAYWLGFIAADGGIIESTNELRVELAGRDVEQVQRLAGALGTNRPLQWNRGCVTVLAASVHMAGSLERVGITPRKSGTVRPWDGSATLMPYYWRGLWDGDGHISRIRNYWDIGICGSPACVQGFADWACGICGSSAKPFHEKAKTNFWKWDVAGKRVPQLLAQVLLLEGSDLGLRRKQVLLEELGRAYFRPTGMGGRRPAGSRVA